MRQTVQRTLRKLVAAAPSLAGQVSVSVAATVCAALITDVALKPAAAPAPAAVTFPGEAAIPGFGPPAFDARRGADLIQASFTVDGLRLRPTHPPEFGAVFGPMASTPVLAPAPSETEISSAPASNVAASASLKRAIVAEACSEACKAHRAAASRVVLPPTRPAIVAEAAPPEPAPAPQSVSDRDEARSLLGFKFPNYMPNTQVIARSVGSVGEAVAGLVGMR